MNKIMLGMNILQKAPCLSYVSSWDYQIHQHPWLYCPGLAPVPPVSS